MQQTVLTMAEHTRQELGSVHLSACLMELGSPRNHSRMSNSHSGRSPLVSSRKSNNTRVSNHSRKYSSRSGPRANSPKSNSRNGHSPRSNSPKSNSPQASNHSRKSNSRSKKL